MKKHLLVIFFVACTNNNEIKMPNLNTWPEMDGVMSNHYNYYRTGGGELVELLDRHFYYDDKKAKIFYEARLHYNQNNEEWFIFYTLRSRDSLDIYILEKAHNRWAIKKSLKVTEVMNFYREYLGIFPIDWELEQ